MACSLNLKLRVLSSASVNITAVAPCSELSPHFADSRIIFFDHLPGFRKSSASSFIICLHNSWHPLKGAPVERPVFPHYDELDKRGEEPEWGRPKATRTSLLCYVMRCRVVGRGERWEKGKKGDAAVSGHLWRRS